ncbi:histidine kinase dimerization/phosphoacceptor domain -containing protein [Actomonas aquatica]|uniref:Histidine kinase dimerization/phosphoacceptor domain -containing protein n=1 Tax=Actomonas aquatica TaxID=2866162 RepID=A0ABZ1C580_9BACT|nr:histidine kinase dimerization/phosphoacceptor domain -containing protein [Opitutus sp. WL0086]WRQ86676.1 histidine kinase dimerization/phosphoacceptor domain -containing protein [Opitutus sp. WL0086]
MSAPDEFAAFDTNPSLDALPHGFVRVDEASRIVDWNQRMEQWTRKARSEVEGRTLDEVFPEHPRILAVIGNVREWRQPQVLSQAFHHYFLPIALPPQHISGFQMMQQEVHLKPLRRPQGHVAITVFDVTAEVVGQAHARQLRVELESARTALAERVEELDASLREVRTLRSALDEHGQVIKFDCAGRVTFANDKVMAITGRRKEEVVGRPFSQVLGGFHDEAFFERVRDQLDAGQVWRGDIKFATAHGRPAWKNMTIVPFPGVDGTPEQFVAIGHDITEHVEAEEAVTASLAEKEILLKEVHHRVKNNMQIISSMLQLQSGYLEDPQFKAVFNNCRSRVLSMAMVHEKLYQSRSLASVDFGRHVEDLSRMLARSFSAEHQRVELKLEVESQMLDIDTAIPVGLMLNELVTNAVKYGRQADGNSLVRVEFRAVEDGELLLAVEDSGPGLPAGFDFAGAKSLGLKMINILARQVRARLHLRPGPGARMEIRFKAPKLKVSLPEGVGGAEAASGTEAVAERVA